MLISFLSSSEAWAIQTEKIDSLRSVLKTLPKDTNRVNTLLVLEKQLRFSYSFEEVPAFISEALELAMTLNYPKGVSRAYIKKSYLFATNQYFNPDSILYYVGKSLEQALKHNLKKEIITAYAEMGLYYVEHAQEDLDSAFHYLSMANELNEPVIDDELKCLALRYIGFCYNLTGDNEKALEYALMAEKTHEDNTHAYTTLAIIYDDMGRSRKAIEYNLKVMEVAKRKNEMTNYTPALTNIAIAYVNIGENDKALEYFVKAYQADSTSQMAMSMANSSSNVGKMYLQIEEYEKGLDYLRRALFCYQEAGMKCPQRLTLQGMGLAHRSLGDLDSAKYYYQLSTTYAERCGSIETVAHNMGYLGEIEFEKGNLISCLSYFTKAYELSDSIQSDYMRQEAFEGLYLVNKKLGRYQTALEYHEKSRSLKDSLFNEENTASIAKMEANFEFNQEKQQLLADQEKEELLLQNEIKRQRILQYAALGGGALFLTLFLSFYISYKRKKKANQVISSQNQKLEELSQFKEGLTHMIAHDMKNSLNTILGFSASEPYDKKMKSISQSGQVLLNLVTNMLDVQRFEEAQVSLNLEACKIRDLVEEARLQVALLFQMKSLRLEINIPDQQAIAVDKELIVRVLVNLLNNAVKYSKPGKLVKLNVSQITENQQGYCQISIADEGEGIEADQLPYVFDKFWKDSARAYGPVASTGLGLTFCKLAVEAHDGKIEVTSESGKGTTFYVNLPAKMREVPRSMESPKTQTEDHKKELIMENEREILIELAGKLKELEVYQVGEINALLQELEEAHIESQWKQNLENAIYQGNESAYKELLEKVNQS